jgi:hypothetical protein
MQQAKLMQKSAQASFDESQAMAPLRKEGAELELQQLKNQVGQQNQTAVQQMAIDGISRFRSDGDTKHLNTWMERAKQNPLGQKLHGDVARFDQLTQTPANDALLREAGIENVAEYYNNPDRFPSLVLVTRTDGTQAVGDMNQIQAQVGYDKYMSATDLEKRERESVITARLRQGQTVTKSDKIEKVIKSLMENNQDLTYAAAYEQVQSMGKTAAGTSGDQAGIKGLMEENPDLSYLDAANQWFDMKKGDTGKTDRDKFKQDHLNANAADPSNPTSEEVMAANAAYDRRTPTSTQKEVGSIEAVKDSLDEIDFFDLDMADLKPKERAQIHRKIGQIEDLRDIKFTTEDKRVMRDFSNLTQLAGTVGEELSEEQTGILDNMLSSAKGYFVNEVGGKAATSAYHTFRNNMRKTLSGQSLTEQEMKAFEKAAGSLKLQLKPALAQFRTQVQTIKNQMESIRDLNDPYLAQFYLGKDIGEVDDVIRNLDARLGDIRNIGLKSTSLQSKEETAATLGEKIKAQDTTPVPGANVDFDALFKEVSK